MNKKILQKNRLHLPFSWLISEGVKIFGKINAKGGPFSSFSWLISRGVFHLKAILRKYLKKFSQKPWTFAFFVANK